MMWSVIILVLLSTLHLRFLVVDGSYLDLPRIHFSGKFRADVNTRNNWACNFDYDRPINQDAEWNSNGTGEWEFLDMHIVTVIDAEGNRVESSPLLGAQLFSNDAQPLAKLVDLDVDHQISTLYGLKLGLRVNNEVWFIGDWTPSVIAHDMWFKMKCAEKSEIKRDAELGASSTSRIVNITWHSSASHLVFEKLTQCPGCSGDLSIAISYNFYSQGAFTVGEVIGTIGSAKECEPLNSGGNRRLATTHPHLTFPPEHTCTKNPPKNVNSIPWTNTAPFVVDKARNTLVIDISNAFSVDIANHPIDLGSLWFGILTRDGKVIIIGEEVPYRDHTRMKEYGGVIEQQLHDELISHLETSLLVIVKDVGDDDQLPPDSVYHVKEALPSLMGGHKVTLLLKELLHYVRPMQHFMDRLEHPVKPSSDVTLLVSTFGWPAPGVTVHMYKVGYEVLPEGGVVVIQDSVKTTETGHATFTFKVREKIPENRIYTYNPCPSRRYLRKYDTSFIPNNDVPVPTELPIDGQVYSFYYCADTDSSNPCNSPDIKGDPLLLCPTTVTMLAFSSMNYQRPYTWINHVKHIFHQMHHLHHIMSTVLNLKNYTDVTLPHNIELLKKSLTKDFNDPNYMPVTRDLSSTKMNMILEWLNSPCYDHDCNPWPPSGDEPEMPICRGPHELSLMRGAVPEVTYFRPPRCGEIKLLYHDDPQKRDTYFRDIFHKYSDVIPTRSRERPLLGFMGDISHMGTSDAKETSILEHFVAQHLSYDKIHHCTLGELKGQLQTATEIEFATVPLYLTSLYSIVQDCNVEAYELMRTVVMQEMLHYAQAANLLISVGGNVVIDSPKTAPKYPRMGLPGNVVPSLHISLKKFTLQHVYRTFMAVETPSLSSQSIQNAEDILHTIGQFYREVKSCIRYLGEKEDIFQGDVSRQVQWPWTKHNQIGKLYTVTDLESAMNAIDEIIDQGEGAGPINPESSVSGQYAHFYSFEEIVCQKRLVKSEDGYSYSGPAIPYNPNGVWPMRDNPRNRYIQPNTTCRTEAKAFHQVYRNFLRVIQETFDGHPEKMQEAMSLMESLQVHAKKVMWIPYDESTTCGPVWDYEWDYI